MLVKIDAATLEWRGAAWLSNDKTAIEEINDGGDFHSANQTEFGLPTRLIAKRYLFRTIYRGSGYAFSVDNDFSVVSDKADFWDSINEKFYKKYYGLDSWHHSLARTCAERKPIRSPLGREWLVLPDPLTGKLPWTVFTNYPVQGTCADLMAIARVSLYRRLRAAKCQAVLVSTVHDDIKVDAPDSEVPFVVDTAYKVFDDLPNNVKRMFGVTLPIKFPGEVSVGKNLLEMEKVK
jgi:DNA polymerase I-like protein with 3'-5' exonuclease and polymerase domains